MMKPLAVCAVILAAAAAIRAAREPVTSVPRASVTEGGDRLAAAVHAATDQAFFSAPAAAISPGVGQITADAYVVGDVVTGRIFTEKNASTVLPVASMSKLITAITATDTMSPTTTVEITPQEASVYPDGSHIGAGERFTVHELLFPLLLDSSNIAAEALASSSDRVKFLELMNGYAWEIGMPHAFFADPSGLSPHNEGAASDFFNLARYLYLHRPDILAVTRVKATSVASTSGHRAHEFASIHPFVDDPRFLGGKTGHTNRALDTMITIMELYGRPVAIVVLHSMDRTKDTQLLIDGLSSSTVNSQ